MFAITGNIVRVKTVGKKEKTDIAISAPFPVAAATFCPDGSSCYLATQNRKVWRFSLHDCQTEKIDEEMEGSEDIFADSSDKPNSSDDIDQDRATQVHMLRIDHLLLTLETSVMDLVVNGGHLYILTTVNNHAIIQLYSLTEIRTAKQHRRDVSIDTPQHTILTGLSDAIFAGLSGKIMYVAVQKKHNQNADHIDKSNVFLDKELFTSLFGTETSMLNSPVLLLTTNDGCLFSFPVKLWKKITRPQVTCQVDGKIAEVLLTRTSLASDTADTNSQTIAALELALQPGSSDNKDVRQELTGLCVISETGDSCLFLPPSTITANVTRFRFSMGSPVKCCMFLNPYLVYSTGACVDACKLTIPDPKSSAASVIAKTHTVLHKAGIVNIFAFDPNSDQSKGFHLMCMNLKLETFSFDVSNEESVENVENRSLKTILKKIKDSANDLKQKRNQTKLQDNFIQQLSLFSSLLHSDPSATARYKQLSNTRIICSFRTILQQKGVSRFWILEVRIRNTGSLTFSNDWIVTASVDDSRVSNSALLRGIKTVSHPLVDGLSPGSDFTFTIQLEHSSSVIEYDLVIGFILKRLDQNEDKALKVTVFTGIIDCFHFLKKASINAPLSNANTRHCCSEWMYRQLQALSQVRGGRSGTFGAGLQQQQSCSNPSQMIEAKLSIPRLKELPDNDIGILKWILHDCDVAADSMKASSCQLETTSGHRVTVSVEQKSVNSDKPAIEFVNHSCFVATLMSNNADLLWQMWRSLGRRLHSLKAECADGVGSELSEGHEWQAWLKSLQKSQSSLATVYQKMQKQKVSGSDLEHLLSECFDKCKDLNLIECEIIE